MAEEIKETVAKKATSTTKKSTTSTTAKKTTTTKKTSSTSSTAKKVAEKEVKVEEVIKGAKTTNALSSSKEGCS